MGCGDRQPPGTIARGGRMLARANEIVAIPSQFPTQKTPRGLRRRVGVTGLAPGVGSESPRASDAGAKPRKSCRTHALLSGPRGSGTDKRCGYQEVCTMPEAETPGRTNPPPETGTGEAVVVIGTSAAVSELAGHMHALASSPGVLGCLLEDHRGEHTVAGLPVLGRSGELASVHEALGFTAALVTLPAEARSVSRAVCDELARLGIEARVVPMVSELVAGRGATTTTSDRITPMPVGGVAGPHGSPLAGSTLDLAALIGREPYGIDRVAALAALRGKRVLITGAGGSIGSELARIVATFEPEMLALMERSENALFEIDRQLARRHPELARKAVLHDVVDERATAHQFERLRPHVVFHAAAHKHVPLMEDHPAHAVMNNLFGTRSVLDAAELVGAERFVLVSTDKAVRPSSVMGATKRLAELYVRGRRGSSRMRRCAVRFGNVLGSAGSVLPIWSAQLSEGGPITVTDARMTRYFMTIHEAATLVVQAGAMAGGDRRGEVFVLDMGEPVRIVDLAERFVRLHGFAPRIVEAGASNELAGWIGEPGDRPRIDITLTGVRPGEKLHEALAYEAETLSRTRHPGVRVLSDTGERETDLASMIADLGAVRRSTDRAKVLAALTRWVPELGAAPASEEPKPTTRGPKPATAA
ncbi:MAG: polysaccharide biosynthesis protein [Phycisphaerales bacterium]|nr:MAG: polysaccharide biosynthesis protein [Phycisphaerales bacterium]